MSLIGTVAELLLSKHTEDLLQLIPFFVLGLALVSAALHGVSRARWTLRAFRALMVLLMAGGVAGSVLHYRAKAEFALERRADLTGLALFREALKGVNPPLLAPGTMLALGLLGLAWAWRQPTDSRGADA